ncbi:hypothetical protein scyTo_0017250, partial [Scyliorhinus torazame]|nr:hypothetical protein [Scyliorhinus torazame]
AQASVSYATSRLPVWAIVLIVLGCLLALFLVFLFYFLICMYTRRKFRGSYDVIQDPNDVHFSHFIP